MIHASEIKESMTLRIDEHLFRVLSVIRHTGSGKVQGFIELKLQDVANGHVTERKFRYVDKVDAPDVTRRQMDFLYTDGDARMFMDPGTFEQYPVPVHAFGHYAAFLYEGLRMPVELLNDVPIAVQFPKTVEMSVSMTGDASHGGQDSTMKSAVLSNGLEVQVPRFIQAGDTIRIETEKARYMERITAKRA